MRPMWLNRSLVVGPFFTLCLNEADFQRELRLMKLPHNEWPKFVKNDHSHATAHIFNHHQHGLCVIVCLQDHETRKPVEVAGLLVHEAVHIWQQFCERVGESNPSCEFEAYSIQQISQQLMHEFVRQTEPMSPQQKSVDLDGRGS